MSSRVSLRTLVASTVALALALVLAPAVSATAGPSATVPGAVTGLTQSGAKYDGVTLSFTPPASDGGSSLTGYALYLDGAAHGTLDVFQTDFAVGGLVSLSQHTVGLAAVNSVGEGPRVTVDITVSSASLDVSQVAGGNVGTPYSQGVELEGSGYGGIDVTSTTASHLPPGISFDGGCGEGCFWNFSGTPTKAGKYHVVITQHLVGDVTVKGRVTIVVTGNAAAGISKRVTFAPDSAHLTASAKATLRSVDRYVRAHHITTVRAVGYTVKLDSNREGWRERLGQLRANAVAAYLESINRSVSVTAVGKGLVNAGRIAVVTAKLPVQ